MLNRREAISGALAGSIGMAEVLAKTPDHGLISIPPADKRLTVHEMSAEQKANRDRLKAKLNEANEALQLAIAKYEAFLASIREQYGAGVHHPNGIEVNIEEDYIFVRDYSKEFAQEAGTKASALSWGLQQGLQQGLQRGLQQPGSLLRR